MSNQQVIFQAFLRQRVQLIILITSHLNLFSFSNLLSVEFHFLPWIDFVTNKRKQVTYLFVHTSCWLPFLSCPVGQKRWKICARGVCAHLPGKPLKSYRLTPSWLGMAAWRGSFWLLPSHNTFNDECSVLTVWRSKYKIFTLLIFKALHDSA